MPPEREELMKRLKLSQIDIERTADKIVDEFKTGKLVKMELQEENITDKILANQSILIFGPQMVGKSISVSYTHLRAHET